MTSKSRLIVSELLSILGPLTAEQLAQIQKNREAALARRAAAAMGIQPASSSSSTTVAAG